MRITISHSNYHSNETYIDIDDQDLVDLAVKIKKALKDKLPPMEPERYYNDLEESSGKSEKIFKKTPKEGQVYIEKEQKEPKEPKATSKGPLSLIYVPKMPKEP